ncbi:transcription initiation factor TFIID subunit 6b [Octopus sinensis]|uniref:Histone H4 n=1 Tax=Octopus sinensis TaxID=2607531 RepID=A0A6P7S6R0_9MOLL|nr:transcription initiation factor TFIID subunit 6b [Octopus sinensis]
MSSKVKDPDIDSLKESISHGNAEEKKVISEKRYIILSRDSIRMMAEAEGISNLTDDGALLLSEDLGYRIRETIQNSIEFMKHAKRRRLTTEDINDALRTSDMQPILGHGSLEPVIFKQVKDAEIHFVEDLDLNVTNIAFNNYKPKETGELGIKSFWYAIEGVSKINTTTSNAAGENWKTPSFGQSKPVIVKKEKKELSENMLQYYDFMVKAILGADEEAMKFALSDLKTNSKIVPLLPYFVNLYQMGFVKTVSHDISQLTRLLHTVKALTNNSNLYLEPEPYLGLLVQSVMYCGLEPLAASINPLNDHWVLRDYAARLLGFIVKKWNASNNMLMHNTLKSLKEVVCDLTKPFCSHYGAVMGLLALGTKAIEEVLLPQLKVYMPHLNSFMEDTTLSSTLVRTDAYKVYGALLLAAEYIMKNFLRDVQSQTIHPKELPQTISLPLQLQQHIKEEATDLNHSESGNDSKNDKLKSSPHHFFKEEPMDSLHSGLIGSKKEDKLKSRAPYMYFKEEPMDLIPSTISNNSKDEVKPTSTRRSPKDIYLEFYEYFGDMLSSKLPILDFKHINRPPKCENLVKLYETNLSGEYMWNTMRERFIAEIKKETEEQERLEAERRKEQERLEREQQERERLESERLRRKHLEKLQKDKRCELQSSQGRHAESRHPDKQWKCEQSAAPGYVASPASVNDDEEDEDEDDNSDDEDEDEDDNSDDDSDDDSEDDNNSFDKETQIVARTVKSNAGIKLVITKIPNKSHLVKNEKDPKTKTDNFQRTERHKKSKPSKRKKQGQKSNRDKYKYLEENNSRMYCKEGESSSNGRKLTLRLKVKDSSAKD